MTDNQMKSRMACCLIVLASPMLLGATGLTNQFEDRVLTAHNRERTMMGVPPLRWNPALANSAQHWANYLAATGKFEHAPENHIAPEGENLWAGTKGYYSIEAMVGAWVREKKNFKPGRFPDNSITGYEKDVGHYTQLIWKNTGEVGCAKSSNNDEEILVCRYSDAGNYVGDYPL